MLAVNVNGESFTLSRIFIEYRCDPLTDVRNILENYEQHQDVFSMTKTMAEFKKDQLVLSSLWNEFDEMLHLCAYFLQHKSLLFSDEVLRMESSHTIVSLARSVKNACSRIQATIGPDMHYHGVVDAMKVLNNAESVNEELQVLKNCEKLRIAETEMTNFEIVALLSELSVPLQHFVHFCDKFDFAISTEDPLFEELRCEAKKFYTASQGPIHACLFFFHRLVCILCSNSKLTTLDSMEALKLVVPWITLLSDILQRQELWKYVEEKEWMGDEGLKRFYEEYNNVTNVLLGQTQSYEMSLLTSVEPVVRIISMVGKCKHSKTTLELFRSFERSKDICAAVVDGVLRNHFHQVHGKLSEIKDWFSNGVNEVSASSAMFTRVMSSGKFMLESEDSAYLLALCFEGDRNRIEKLSGDALDNFILHLGLIQNESKLVSSSMDGLIEQFQVFKAAYRHFIIMDAVGYSSISPEHISCRTGLDHMEDTKILYKVIVEHSQTFKNWLFDIRKKYKSSMLFWTNELRDLNEALIKVDPDAVVHFMARLFPLWERGWNANKDRVRQCIVQNVERFSNNGAPSWLEKVAHFVDNCHGSFTGGAEYDNGVEKSEIILHSMCCTNEEERLCLFSVLTQIYKDRLPYAFEVLDGSVPCSEDRLSLFLDRAVGFPSLKFTIVNVDKLNNKNLESLLLFLSDRKVESMRIRLSCIQRGDSLIHTSPWVEGKFWSPESLHSNSSHWNTEIEKNTNVVVVANKYCSSGKSYYIKRKMKDHASCVQSSTLTIHENSNVSTLVHALKLKIGNTRRNQAIHISFLYLPTGASDENWLSEMNHFFFSLIMFRYVYDPISAGSFSMTGKLWLYIETPTSSESGHVWLKKNIPIISSCAEFPDIRMPFDIDQKARRVCTYLRAYDNGTIDRRYECGSSKRIVLVLDTSGSMNGTKFEAAKRNAISIFDSHIVAGDEFGVILFDHETYNVIPIQVVDSNSSMTSIRNILLNLHFYGGGTSMFTALSDTFTTLLSLNLTVDSWVICLTDGVSDQKDYATFRELLMQSQENHHLVTVGIELPGQYEQTIVDMCQKFPPNNISTKGFFVQADGTSSGMDDAFKVVKSRIPVSQTFDHDGVMSDDECRRIMVKYLPDFIEEEDMMAKSFWIRFLYRRVVVFDNNESFNYNETYENLGSSLMTIMLIEVERLLAENQQRDWQGNNFIQLIYDFTNPEKPEFRLVCTAPNDIDPETEKKLRSFDLPGFHIPSKQELDNRNSLDLFLSAALGVPRQENDDGLLRIKCIDDHGFVLTIDFTMKLLSIHERIACQVPCVIEGETGVSKTALTKMYSILRNHSLTNRAQMKTAKDLSEIEHRVKAEGFTIGPNGSTILERLSSAMELDAELAERILDLIQEKAAARPSIFVALPPLDKIDESTHGRQYLELFANSRMEETFFEINIDASLTERDFMSFFVEINAVAAKILDSEATVVVFLDEINTSSVLGLLKEIIIDRSLSGEMLMHNIAIVGACNPPRAQIQTSGREQDQGRTWASGHYQVSELPPSLRKMKWSFGALSSSQEKEFVYRRMEMIHNNRMKPLLRASLTEIVSTSHELIRIFAKENISDTLNGLENISDVEHEATERARSVVSLRDIQRVFSLYSFFVNDMDDILNPSNVERSAILLSIAIVYYLRLDAISRNKFVQGINALPTEINEEFKLIDILNKAMDTVVAATTVSVGIAMTRGLKENVFTTLICSLSQTPLIIVGPPGASKTLAVQMVGDNASGLDSHSTFYSTRPRLSLFHYQCSKTSTSKEIGAVFSQALERQENVDSNKHRCVVFMDEAGLPEEEKESLKVLHYLLEGHMSAKSTVGFVAISNHILDAAKSNRCAMLLRQDPDEEEMLAIAVGVLFDFRPGGHSCVHDVQVEDSFISAQQFAQSLCLSYSSLFDVDSPVFHLNTFYGLRDFIYLLKAIRFSSSIESTRLITTIAILVHAIERNFNGVLNDELHQIVGCFVNPLISLFSMKVELLNSAFRDPLNVLKGALHPAVWKNYAIRPRFKMVIDCTEDDSILRLLTKSGVVELTPRSLHKLSSLPEDTEFEQIRLVSGVKFAAMQGNFALLSQTEAVNESFYDLFNQRFHELTKQDGSVTMFANIAVGGVSRRSLVLPTFECVVHVRESNLLEIPSPFLNRFEKYRLTLTDVLYTSWSKVQNMSGIVVTAKHRLEQMVAALDTGSDSLCWVADPQTSESIFIDMLPGQGSIAWNSTDLLEDGLADLLLGFNVRVSRQLEKFTSLRGLQCHVDACIQLALKIFPDRISSKLENLLRCNDNSSEEQTIGTNASASTDDDNEIVNIVCWVMQMVLTRIAAFRIVQLCTPEFIFINRDSIPPEVVKEYFSQQHFSLKDLFSSLTNVDTELPLMIVHTRSDHLIHAIPCLPVDRVSEDSGVLKVIQKIIHDNPDSVVVEHIYRLRSESMIRTSIQEWLASKGRDNYIIFVDMSHREAVDQVNYVRMQVEQQLLENKPPHKSFSMVLHYPPSSSLRTNCYPALFLGGWEHVFLDSAGDSSLIDIDCYISHACMNDNSCVKGNEKCAQVLLTTILPNLLPYLVSQSFFYRDQTLFLHGSFTDRKTTLTRLLAARIDSSTFEKILCGKFAEMWFDRILERVIRRSSVALVNGTTQLSLAMSIHSAMVHIFQSFLSDVLVQANQWKNLDLISSSTSNVLAGSPHCLKLFEKVLLQVPTLPTDELILQRHRLSINRLVPLPLTFPNLGAPRFPFFQLISSYLDELVENVFESIALRKYNSSQSLCTPTASEVFEQATVHINDGNEDLERQERLDRRKVALSVVDYIVNCRTDSVVSSESPFDVYLLQYTEWKIGCKSSSIIQQWWMIRLQDLDGAMGNIIAVHVIAKIYQTDIIRIASAVDLLESMNESLELKQQGDVLNSRDLCHILFQSIENRLTKDPTISLQWPLLISSAFNKAETTTTKDDDNEVAERLRNIGRVSVSVHINPEQNNVVELNPEQSNVVELNGARSTDVRTISRLERFLSPLWVQSTNFSLSADVEELLDEIEKGVISGSKAVGLLKTASYRAGAVSGSLFHGYSINVLLQATARLNPGNTAQFTETGERCSLPHFIPQWLQTNTDTTQVVEVSTSVHNSLFVTDYRSGISGNVAKVLYDFFLSIFAAEAATTTSARLFLILWNEIEVEAQVNRQKYTQLSRLRSMGTATSLEGSQTAMIGIEARVLCFVAKIASEIAIDSKSCILEEAYGREAIRFLDELMGTRDVAKWQDFFISTILRLRGEGTLSSVLKGPLTCFRWCKEWAEGIPDCGSPLLDTLTRAETALNNIRADEQWRSQNQRCCPLCRQAFTVSAVNCGRFVCGRDYHRNNGQIIIDGAAAQNAQGCGREFLLNEAISYRVDETKIAAQQAIVDEISAKIEYFNQCSSLWNRARTLSIPPLVVVDDESCHDNSIYPYVKLLAKPGASSVQKRCINNIRVLWEYNSLAPLMLLLPDLIELYMWLHETFRFLVTKEFTATKSMFDLMRKEVLQDRFDSARVCHLLELWERANAGFNDFLITNKQRVNFECEDVVIPFERLRDAKLIFLLSEGSHPTENDFLFLVILHIVSKYNSFTQKLSPFCTNVSDVIQKRPFLSPRCIKRGFGGAIRIGSIAPLPFHCLNWIAECSWDTQNERFDLAKVEILLNEVLNLQDIPSEILNPLDNLREKFCFRNDYFRPVGVRDTDNNIVSNDRRGNFHGNFHDFELFEAVLDLLQLLDMMKGDDSIRRTIMDVFQCLDYKRIRALLEGCRNILEELFEKGQESSFKSLEALLLRIDPCKTEGSLILHIQEYGFPEMDKKQLRLIVSLNTPQLVELVWYCGYQLASEAHLFSNLPLYVGDPLTDQSRHELETNLLMLSKDMPAKTIAKNVDEFVRDVLGYYECQIVDEASKSVEALRNFLVSQNFSDSSDQVFAALPKSISLRNYISVRQLLQQIKLSFLSRVHNSQESSMSMRGGTKPGTMSEGQCWLWEDTNYRGVTENKDDIEHIKPPPHHEQKFWFESNFRCPDTKDEALQPQYGENNSITTSNPEMAADEVGKSGTQDEGQSKESLARSTLQRWWRMKYKHLQRYDAMTNSIDIDIDDDDDDDADDHEHDDDGDYGDATDSILGHNTGIGNKVVTNFHVEIKPALDTGTGTGLATNLPEFISSCDITYGTNDDEIRMRDWLDRQRLPQTIADAFVPFGVRSVEDICFLLSEDEDNEIKELLSSFAPLDRRKLRKAVKALSSTSPSLLSDAETFSTVSNWLEDMD